MNSSVSPHNHTSLEGQSLEDYLQQYVAGVSRLGATMVRPRWQPEPANLPDYGVDWAAVGITAFRPVGIYAWVGHHPDGAGYSEMQRHEELDVLVSFYGLNAAEYAGHFHNGLMVWQNFAVLRLVGMAIIEVMASTNAPELVRERWWNRVDKPLVFRRIIVRDYPVLNVLSSQGLVCPAPQGVYQAPWDTDNFPHPEQVK